MIYITDFPFSNVINSRVFVYKGRKITKFVMPHCKSYFMLGMSKEILAFPTQNLNFLETKNILTIKILLYELKKRKRKENMWLIMSIDMLLKRLRLTRHL